MKQESTGLDRDFKLGKKFFLVYAFVGPITLLLIWPWLKGQPSFSIIAGALVIPFSASIPVYTFMHLFYLILFKNEITSKQIYALIITLIFVLLACGIIFMKGMSLDNPFLISYAMCFFATALYQYLSHRRITKDRD
jgi:hypothetical protein